MKCTIVNKIIYTLEEMDRSKKNIRTDFSEHGLSYSELLFINTIYENPGSNAAQLARILDVSRVAITQWANSLEYKKIIERYTKDGNKKEKYFKLTQVGLMVLKKYHKYYEDSNKNLCNYIRNLNTDERELIMDFLDILLKNPLTEFNCNYEENCRCII